MSLVVALLNELKELEYLLVLDENSDVRVNSAISSNSTLTGVILVNADSLEQFVPL